MKTVLLSLLKKDLYTKYSSLALKLIRSDEPKEILRALDVCHEKSEKDLSIEDLIVTLASCYPEKKNTILIKIVESWKGTEYNPNLVVSYLEEERKKSNAFDIALKGLEYSEGRIEYSEFQALINDTQEPIEESEFKFTTDSLSELKDQTIARGGLKWRLKVLNRLLGPLPNGSFGFVFGRPDIGKSSFLCSEIPYMASQLQEGRPVLWIANEEDPNIVKLRCYQSTFSLTEAQLFANLESYERQFIAKLGGRLLINADSDCNNRRVIEQLIELHNPGMLVIDQLDNVEGFKDSEKREVMLGLKYRWGRETALKNQIPVMAITQAAGSGEGKKFLTMNDVEEAKTQKQKHADYILGIGRDVDNENMRYFHSSKDKLSLSGEKDPAMRHGFGEAVLKGDVSRYFDVGYQEERK